MTAGGLSLVAVAAAGCTSTTSRREDPPDGPQIVADPDRELLLDALDAEESVRRLVTLARRRHRTLRDLLAGTEEGHSAHVDLLGGALEDGHRSPRRDRSVPGRPRQALDEVRRAERGLATSHAATAMAARSGTFARLMAGLSAAAAQQEVALAQASGPSRGGSAT